MDATPAAFAWVVDTTAPTLSLSASATSLWPVTGKVVVDTISGAITDDGAGVDPQSLMFVVRDEYGQVQPSGPVAVGADGRFSFLVPLEASRLGDDLDGRRYEVVVSARDAAGNRGTASIVIVVPHDQRK